MEPNVKRLVEQARILGEQANETLTELMEPNVEKGIKDKFDEINSIAVTLDYLRCRVIQELLCDCLVILGLAEKNEDWGVLVWNSDPTKKKT